MAKKMAKKAGFSYKDGKQIIISVDDRLAYHLEHAEAHLIEAVKLFERTQRPSRHPDYLRRLIRAQETVTTLYREELIRIRGPIKNAMAVTIKRRK